MEQIKFENLPEAISRLSEKVSHIEQQLSYSINADKHSQSKEQFLTVHQAADLLNLAVPTVYQMISRRELPYMKRSKRIYFLREELINYLKQGRERTVSEIQAEAVNSIITKNNKG